MMKYTFDVDSFSDLYKDTYNVRPRNHEFFHASDDRKQEIWDDLLLEHAAVMDEYDRRQKEAVEMFNEKVQELIESGAVTRKTAIRWLIEAEDDEYCDVDYILYVYNLPYSMKRELQDALEV